MKKTILLLLLLAFTFGVIKAQNGFVDDAVQGTGYNKFNYSGAGWVHGQNSSDLYLEGTVSFSNQVTNFVTLKFIGNRVSFYASKAAHHGIAGVSIDNGPEIKVDLYAPSRESIVIVYSSGILTLGEHTVKIRVTGTKNAASTDTYVILDGVWTHPSSTNTSLGEGALSTNEEGQYNTAVGTLAMEKNTAGSSNVAVGHSSLRESEEGFGNVAIGVNSMSKNVWGDYNTATGSNTLAANHTGNSSSAYGYYVLASSVAAENNGFGYFALNLTTTGTRNDAMGVESLSRNTTGSYNIGVGYRSMLYNSSGSQNVAIGPGSLAYNSTGNNNTAIGYNAGPTLPIINLENSTAIGYSAQTTASNQVRIGNAGVTSIGGQVSWSTLSDGRFKKDIKEDVSGLDFIAKLRPVSYTVDKESVEKFLRIPDSLRTNYAEAKKKPMRQTGFVAQEVEDLVKKTGYVFHGVEAPKNEGDHYSIRYAEFVVPLVKAVQELNDHDAEQKQMIEDMKKEILTLKEGLQAYAGGALSEKIESVLYQNNPNPFFTDTEIKMEVPESAVSAVVMVYNLEGKQLKDVRVQGRGKTGVKIGGSELNAGMYLYALIVDGKVVDTKRMILTK